MHNVGHDTGVGVFSTCPPSSGYSPASYARSVVDVARWSEEAGCRGILVYTDNSLVDPWLVSQLIIQQTESLCPLVAVQPAYMHPYTVAKMVTSFGHLHRRRVYLNMVAGGFKNDLAALDDTTPHDRRYERLSEYTTIIKRLLASPGAVSYQGRFYRVRQLKLSPPLPPELFPGIFVSGSSEAGLSAARALGATAIKYPGPAREYRKTQADDSIDSGIRVGIISRERDEEAWAIARARFPEDRGGQLAHQLAMKVSDSAWHKQLSEMGRQATQEAYWVVPFKNYKTMCPYLVGSYERVATELAGYLAAGCRTFILDAPPSRDELHHVSLTFDRAREVARCPSY